MRYKHLYCDDATHALVVKIAYAEKISISDVCRQLVGLYIAHYGPPAELPLGRYNRYCKLRRNKRRDLPSLKHDIDGKSPGFSLDK